MAPAGTPKYVIGTLHDAVVAALHDDGVRKVLDGLGVDIVGDTPEEFAAYIKSEIPKWTAVIKASGAKLQYERSGRFSRRRPGSALLFLQLGEKRHRLIGACARRGRR